MADRFAVGDIIRMKKPHPCGTYEWEYFSRGGRLSSEMYRMRTSGYGAAETGGKKHKRN